MLIFSFEFPVVSLLADDCGFSLLVCFVSSSDLKRLIEFVTLY